MHSWGASRIPQHLGCKKTSTFLLSQQHWTHLWCRNPSGFEYLLQDITLQRGLRLHHIIKKSEWDSLRRTIKDILKPSFSMMLQEEQEDINSKDDEMNSTIRYFIAPLCEVYRKCMASMPCPGSKSHERVSITPYSLLIHPEKSNWYGRKLLRLGVLNTSLNPA